MVEDCNINSINICRACLTSTCPKMISLFTNNLAENYASCTSLKVSQEDFLPHKLCAGCTEFVLKWFDFREQCRQSESIILEQLKKSEQIEETQSNNRKQSIENNCKKSAQSLTSEIEIKCEIGDYNSGDSEKGFDADFIENSDDEKLILSKETLLKKTLADISETTSCHSLTSKRTLRKRGGKCALCHKIFSYKGALATHLEICGKDGKRVRKYNPQVEKKKLIPKSDALFCGICSTKSNSDIDLKNHLDEHRQSNNLSCQICKTVALDFADLISHRYTHQEKGYSIRIRCHICLRRFAQTDSLEFHIRGVHMSKKPGLCKFCGKSFVNFKNWRLHRRIHAGAKIECHICYKNFTSNRSLVYHMKCHSDVKEFICHLCGFACKLPAGLASHHFRMHSNNDPIPCSHCDKKFKNKETLREHLLRVNGERNHECQKCGKKYRSQKELEYHEKWHSDVKPFVCNRCGKSYKSSTHLKNHMRQHTGERPFECGICCSSFMTSSVLKKHRMIHSGERPHICHHCGKAFIEKSNLKNHMKTHRKNIDNLSF